MKVGDTVPVTIGGHVVAQATVKGIEDGAATLVVPATLVVMGVRTELTDLPETTVEGETVIMGAERTDATAPENMAPAQSEAPAPSAQSSAPEQSASEQSAPAAEPVSEPTALSDIGVSDGASDAALTATSTTDSVAPTTSTQEG